jgi:hypothetical protein
VDEIRVQMQTILNSESVETLFSAEMLRLTKNDGKKLALKLKQMSLCNKESLKEM